MSILESNRISTEESIKEEYTYIDGLMYVGKILIEELKILLEDEGRNFGIMISYFSSIDSALTKLFTDEMMENEEIYQKILFLYKPLIMREYRKLGGRKLSKADRVIVILYKLFEVLYEIEDYPGHKELGTIRKIITKLYNNIRNTSKKSALYHLINSVRKYKDLGYIGKSPLKSFSIKQEEQGREKTILEDNGIRIDEEFGNKVIEELL